MSANAGKIGAVWDVLTEQGWFKVDGIEFKCLVEYRTATSREAMFNQSGEYLWRLRAAEATTAQWEGKAKTRVGARQAAYRKARKVAVELRQLKVNDSIKTITEAAAR